MSVRISKDRPDPEGQRDLILTMIFELVESFLPENDKAMPPDAEHRVADIHRQISYALQIQPEG